MQVLLPPGCQLGSVHPSARNRGVQVASSLRLGWHRAWECSSFRSARRGSTLSISARCRPLTGAEGHPDWPRNPERYKDLRDEDIIELEKFLQVFQRQRAEQVEEEEGPGEVHLVGTGPGDPGLLTLRALQLMQTADVVLYDRLVSDDILRLVGPQARMVYVGKHSGFHTRTQDEIHALLLAFAEAGATVIRLKGGDPYVFGRGGEEVQYLSARGIQVHCVPGITAASGICAELGIPMTHRGVATSVRFLTGHARDGGEQELLDSTVAGAADPHTTLVVYMGLQTLPKLYQQLSAHGLPSDVPAVAVERGTTRRQRVVWGTVGSLPGRAVSAGLKSPTLIIIGQVVALAPGYQAWSASGRPITSPARLPRHDYALPSLDVHQLNLLAIATGSEAFAQGPAGDSSIRTRAVSFDVPFRGSQAAVLSAPAVDSIPVQALPEVQVQPGEIGLGIGPTEAGVVGPQRSALSEVLPVDGGARQRHEESEDGPGCGGMDDVCPLPFLK